MFKRFLSWRYALYLAATMLYSVPCQAQFGVTIGIDKDTLHGIEALPDNIKKALLDAIREALPLVDKSVAQYLAQIDKILETNIESGVTAIQCASAGNIKIIEKDISTSLGNILYTGRRAGLNGTNVGDYTQSLSDAISTARKNMNVDTEATQVLIAYSDLLIQAAAVKCVGGINYKMTNNEIEAEIRRVLIPQLEWDILIGDRDHPYCKKIPECTAKRRKDIADYLLSADKVDQRDTVAAKEIMASIPPDFVIPKPFNPFAAQPIQILDYEANLISLRLVERAVEASKADRVAKAKALWDKAVAARDNAVSQVNNNNAIINFPGANAVDWTNAIERSPGLISISNEATSLAKQALAKDAGYTKQVDELTAAMNNNIARIDTIREAAHGALSKAEIKTYIREKREGKMPK